jgi:hypothetical protein
MRNLLIIILLLSACTSTTYHPKAAPRRRGVRPDIVLAALDGPVKGAVFLGNTISGDCMWKPFIKTDDTMDNPDTNEPQILGYSPGNVVIARDGKDIIPERVLASAFHTLGGFVASPHGPCRVPQFNE